MNNGAVPPGACTKWLCHVFQPSSMSINRFSVHSPPTLLPELLALAAKFVHASMCSRWVMFEPFDALGLVPTLISMHLFTNQDEEHN